MPLRREVERLAAAGDRYADIQAAEPRFQSVPDGTRLTASAPSVATETTEQEGGDSKT